MENNSKNSSKKTFSETIVSQYTFAYFDHLHSEYVRIASTIDDKKNQMLGARMGTLIERRKKGELTWHDVYVFDLEMLDLLSDEDLVRKAYDMRSKYRSIAGARDYDAYIASKPPDLTTLQLEAIKKPEIQESVATEVLRADIRYLLGQFYLHYAMMPLREGLRDELTRLARKWTFIFMGVFSLLSILFLIIQTQSSPPPSDAGRLAILKEAVAWPVWWVVCAGIMGGCVSMLQRIQSTPNEGDALYNLAALSHGWKGISLSPLYGVIFAMLLYVLFTAGILQGTVFPEIVTQEERNQKREASRLALQAKSTTNSNKQETSAVAASPPTSALPAPTPMLSPQPETRLTGLPFSDTVPQDNKAYALLIIWSFIAGFAERLVPDTLNRLVTKHQSIQGTNT
ncbi:MAG TPA: hypothetical protein VNA19_09495 [Pyrinomonadaceae bacterium]|jgi:hypothetical protein|nr:hypothetical protein [Pyrinomonadaceae bacterium]